MTNPTYTCGHLTGFRTRCKNRVSFRTARCAAGHPVNKKLMKAVAQGREVPLDYVVQFDAEDMFVADSTDTIEIFGITVHHAEHIDYDEAGDPVATHRCVECGAQFPAPQGQASWTPEVFGVPEQCTRYIHRHRVDNTCRGEIVPL